MNTSLSSYAPSLEACIHMHSCDAKAHLRDLEKYMPVTPFYMLSAFGAYVAEHLDDEVDPQGFVYTCEKVLSLIAGETHDLTRPVPQELLGYSATTHGCLRKYIPRIAEAVFSSDFARGVCAIIESRKTTIVHKKERPPIQLGLGI